MPKDELALSVQKLNKDFPHFSLKDVSFSVPLGSVVGLVGENGSGKTTCVRCILGQDVPTSGTIEILDQLATQPSSHGAIAAAFESCPFQKFLRLNKSPISCVKFIPLGTLRFF